MASLNNRKRGTTGLSDCAKEKQNAQPEPASAEKGTGGERLPRAAKRKKTGNEGINQTTDNTSSLLQHKIGVNQVEAVADTQRVVSTRVKRQAWTSTAMASFFEGLAEHGKAFERILAFMQGKQKKKQTEPFISNLGKNQVRFFYYRTWHKVSSLLTKAQKELQLQSPNKRGTQTASSVVKTKKVKIQSDDEETEGEIVEGDVHFDTSLDEGEELADKPSVPTLEEETVTSLPGLHDNTSPYNNPSSVEADVEYDKDAPPISITSTNSENVNMATVTDQSQDSVDCILLQPPPPPPPPPLPPLPSLGSEVTVETEKVIMGTSKKKEGSNPMIKVNDEWHSLDLVAMLCYSKLKQKYTGDQAAFGKKLYELVYQGNTTIRNFKGKRKLQLKIPNCPALRTTVVCTKGQPSENTRTGNNEFTDTTESSSPAVTIELVPLNSSTWEYIQSLSINPRLRLKSTPLARTLRDVMEFIGKKWHLPLKGIFQTIKLYKAVSPLVMEADEAPLQLSAGMTVKELQDMVAGTDKHRISLQYHICHESDSSMSSPSLFLMALLDFFQSTESSPAPLTPTDNDLDQSLMVQSLPPSTPPLSGSSPPPPPLPLPSPFPPPPSLPPPLPPSSSPSLPPLPLPPPPLSLPPPSPSLPSPLPLPPSLPSPLPLPPPPPPPLPPPSPVPSLIISSSPLCSPPPLPPPVVMQPLVISPAILPVPPLPPLLPATPTDDPVIASSSTPVSLNMTTPTSPSVAPPPPQRKKATPTSHSCSALLSSPTVRQYWESLSTKSPLRSALKSPLHKYKKLSRVSPLKKASLTSPNSRNAHHQVRKPVKRTRLDFSQVISSDTKPSSSLSTLLPSPSSQKSSVKKRLHSKVPAKPQPSHTLIYDLTCSRQKERSFSLARLNSEKSKNSNSHKQEKVHHVVTMPKNSFPTGPFSTIRLSDLFQSVQDNLKDSETKSKPGPTTSATASPVSSTPAASTVSDDVVMPTVSKAVTATVLQDIAPPDELQDAILATAKTPNSLGSVGTNPVSISLPVLPPIPPPPLPPLPPPSLPTVPFTDPSPLQVYASQVASSQPARAGVQVPNVFIKTLTSTPSQSTSSIKTTQLLADIKMMRKKNANPSSKQRPVIPKPLQYFPISEVVGLMSSPTTTIAAPATTVLPSVPVSIKCPTTTTTVATLSQQKYGKFTSPSTSLTTANKYLTMSAPSSSVTSGIGGKMGTALSNEALSSSNFRVQPTSIPRPLRPPPPPLPPPPPPPPQNLQTPPVPALPQAPLNHQELQERLTSLLLNMLISQQQQMRLPVQQQQQVQAVLNSLAPPLSVSTVSSNSSNSISASTSQTATAKAVSQVKSVPVTLPTTISADIPSLTEAVSLSSVLPHITSTESMQTSDTVNELLRGLTSNEEEPSSSLKKLSEETVDVLPTFARAMMQMSSSTAVSASLPVTSTGEDAAVKEEPLLSSNPPPLLTDEGHISNDNSLLQLMQGANDEESVNNTFSDTSLKHIIENADFADMFSQLRDILKTPDKRLSGSTSLSSREESNKTSPSIIQQPQEQEPSNREAPDIFSSPFKLKSHHESTAVRSLMEDTSVDYINKFREMASAMSQTASQVDFNHMASSSSSSSLS